MKKQEMREWVSALGDVIDHKLSKWKKDNPIENGEAVRLSWQFGQVTIEMYVFWEDQKEEVKLQCNGPRFHHYHEWSGLKDSTFNNIMDRVGNWAQVVMYPPHAIDET